MSKKQNRLEQIEDVVGKVLVEREATTTSDLAKQIAYAVDQHLHYPKFNVDGERIR